MSTIKGETIWGWGGEDTSLGTTHLFNSAVEAHRKVLAEEREREEAIALNTIKQEMEEVEVEDLQCAWKARETSLNTTKTQKHIDILLKWILDDGGKQTIIHKLRSAIATATHKRDLKADLIHYCADDLITYNNISYRVDWIVLHTDALAQIAKAFNSAHFSAHRIKSLADDTMTLILKFWP